MSTYFLPPVLCPLLSISPTRNSRLGVRGLASPLAFEYRNYKDENHHGKRANFRRIMYKSVWKKWSANPTAGHSKLDTYHRASFPQIM